MNLAEKGRYAPPPRLPLHAGSVSSLVASWPQVHARTHWRLGDETEVDGADFYVGQREVGHIHLDGEAHIAMSKPLRDALVEAGLAAPFPWSPSFVVFSIQKAADIAPATALFQLAYDRVRGVPSAELLSRIALLAKPRARLSPKRVTGAGSPPAQSGQRPR